MPPDSARRTGEHAGRLPGRTYADKFLPTGLPIGSPEDCLDCACSLYLGDPVT